MNAGKCSGMDATASAGSPCPTSEAVRRLVRPEVAGSNPAPATNREMKTMTEERRREYCRNWHRKYRELHRVEINARNRELRRMNIEHCRELEREKNRRRWARAKQDPELYAKLMSYKQTPEQREKDRVRAAQWRKNHKKRYRRLQRLRYDRDRAMCRQSPEFYALYRRQKRLSAARSRRKLGLVKRPYRPRMSMRIPDTCSYGRVLDTRSVFLWNNAKAASLMAGRAYKFMQWREIHCDRFGNVCR